MKAKAGILVFLIGLIATQLAHAGEPLSGSIRYNTISDAERTRINGEDAELKKEDFGRSVDELLLGSALQFGGILGQSADPQTDLENLLSARRAIKILDHIHGLPERDKGPACEALFDKAFQIHTNLFSVWVSIQADPKIQTKSSVESSRLTILLAMFATAERGDRVLLAKQFAELDRFADEANRIIAAQPPTAKTTLSTYIPFFFPQENRSQLNLLRLAADREKDHSLKLLDQVEPELKKANMPESEVPIVSWDAGTKYSKTKWPSNAEANAFVTAYKFYDWGDLGLNHELQTALVKKLRGIVLP